MSLGPYFYRYFIDPMTVSIRRKIVTWVPRNSHILDIASGTGALCFDLAPFCKNVTGIDNSAEMIRYSQSMKEKRGTAHLDFRFMDATGDLDFDDQSYHLCILSMAMHQFSSAQRASILMEALRVGRTVILADYSFPLPRSVYGFLARSIEKLVGGEHYRNFMSYNSNQGLKTLLDLPSIKLTKSDVVSSGIFSIVQVTRPNQSHYINSKNLQS